LLTTSKQNFPLWRSCSLALWFARLDFGVNFWNHFGFKFWNQFWAPRARKTGPRGLILVPIFGTILVPIFCAVFCPRGMKKLTARARKIGSRGSILVPIFGTILVPNSGTSSGPQGPGKLARGVQFWFQFLEPFWFQFLGPFSGPAIKIIIAGPKIGSIFWNQNGSENWNQN